jgi:APA family basic amino acid/polyamine antiporter
MPETRVTLPRFLGPVGATLLIVTYAVGTAIFLVPGIIARDAGSAGASIALWIAGGLLIFCGSLCYAELAVRVPKSGAEYRYLYAGFGPPLAFVFAWTSLFAQPVAIAAVARGFADYLAEIWPMQEALRRAAGAAAIVAFAAVSMRSTPAAMRVAGVAAVGKILALLTLAAIGIAAVPAAAPPAIVAPSSGGSAIQWLGAMVAIIWAFDGFSSVATLAGEVRDPRRTLPLSLFAGIGIVTLIYVTTNLVYFRVLGFAGVAASDAVAASVLQAVIGPAGANVIAALVMASALGSLAAQMVGNPRYFLGPAEDGLFPARLAAISPRTLTPANAILFTAAIAIGLVTIGGYELLIRLYVLSYFPMTIIALFAAVRLRRRDGVPQGFAMPLYPLPLVVYGVGILGVCIASAIGDPAGALFGLMVPVTGALVYRLKFR